jgi:thiosulfate/3-mercaptopyruvate sulfurtransferase
MHKTLVTSEWLNENLSDPKLIILDASEESNVTGKKVEFEGLQIKGARYFDLEHKFSDSKSKLPHTFPSTEQFESESRKLGINADSIIVVYDNIGIYTSPRVWWMYKIMGHQEIYVLDGGLSDWVKKGFETEKQERKNYPKGNFKARLTPGQIDTKEDILENLQSKKKILIDARSSGRFNGTAPEPRDWVQNGHIPGSLNLPFDSLIEDGKYKSKEEIKKLFKDLKIGDQPLSFVCGSGLTSCILLLASKLVQDNPLSVYDASWTEWGSTEGMPIEKR